MVEDTEFQKLWQIRAVRKAVLENLQVRVKRDDDKVTQSQAKLKKIFEQAWYKNLGGLYPSVQDFINATTDLQVTYLSLIQEMQKYLKELNTWATKVEQTSEEVQTLQQLNNDLSIQLKEVENELARLKKEPCPPKKNKKKEEKTPENAEEKEPEVPDVEEDEEGNANQEPTFEL